MKDLRIAVVGIGATGAILAAALLSRDPETILVDSVPGLGETLKKKGIRITGAISYDVPVKNFVTCLGDMKHFNPNLIFISTKTFHLPQVIDQLQEVFRPGTKIICTQNGLGPEDLIAEKFGADSAFRMSLEFGCSLKGPGEVEMAFFHKPNFLGSLSEVNRGLGLEVAKLFTASGFDTEFVDNIKRNVWEKMILKCTVSSICAVTDRTLKDVLTFPPTREIADACFQEALAVAKAEGYDIGDEYKKALAYLEQSGVHKDSMCSDVANKRPTEVAFLGGKVVEYGRAKGIPTPFFVAMTNLVKTIEDKYSRK